MQRSSFGTSRQQRSLPLLMLLSLSLVSDIAIGYSFSHTTRLVQKKQPWNRLLHPKRNPFPPRRRQAAKEGIFASQDDSSNDPTTNQSGVSSSAPLDISNNSTIVTTASQATTTESATAKEEQDATTSADGVMPSYRRLIVFTATTILIWLSEPLLSLVDTTIVGLTSTSKNAVLQIAALGPATTMYDSAIYLTYGLAIATTNRLAPALAKKDYQELCKSTSHLMGLALLFGTLVMAITFGWGRSIISQMVGSSITEPQLIPLATNYAKIRAAVAPLCVVDFVAQSFCLTILDTKTPALAVTVASLVNIVGDMALSPIWGIQGAAVATAAATSASCAILVHKVGKVMSQWKVKQQVQEAKKEFLQVSPNNSSDAIIDSQPEVGEEAFATNAVDKVNDLSTKTEVNDDIPFFSLPNKSAMIDLMKLAGPIFFVMMGKIACYSVLTVRATSFGVLPLATHNIMMRVFFFFACFGDSLSQAAQSFYPQVPKNKRRNLIKRLFYLSAAVGLCNNQMSQLILKQFGKFLTKDASIIQMMGEYSPYVGLAVLLHPFIMLFEGTVLAKRDLVFMVGMYILTGLLHFGHVFSPVSASFMGLWRALFVFQFIRLVQFAARVWDTSRKEKRASKSLPFSSSPSTAVVEI